MKLFTVIFSIVIAVLAIYYGVRLFRLNRGVSKWMKVKAKVLSKGIIPKKLSTSGRVRNTVTIEYSYKINGVEYKNNVVFLVELMKGEKGFLIKDGEKFLKKINSDIEIFVNPENNNESVVYCDGLIMYIFVIFMGFLSAMIGLLNYIS